MSYTEGFSPADIEYAARSAFQRALEKAVYSADADAFQKAARATWHAQFPLLLDGVGFGKV